MADTIAEINVRIRAQAGDLTAGMQQAASAVRQGVAQMRGSLSQMGADDSIAQLRKQFEEARSQVDDFKRSTQEAAGGASALKNAIGAVGITGAVVIASEAFSALIRWVRSAWEEHEKLVASADRLHLRVGDVKRYSDSMLELSQHLQDVASGLDVMTEAERRNLKALGVDASNYATAAEQAMQKIIASRGTDEEKITAWRKVTGESYEKAKKDLEAYERQLKAVINLWTNRAQTFGQSIGVVPNSGPATSSLGLTSKAGIKDEKEDNQAFWAHFRDLQGAAQSKLLYVKSIIREINTTWKELESDRAAAGKGGGIGDWLGKQSGAGSEALRKDMARIQRDMAQQDRALEIDAAAHRRDLSHAEVEARQADLQRMAEAGEITRAQELSGLLELEQRRFEFDQADLERSANNAGLDVLQRQQANEQLELLEIQHGQRMGDLQAQMTAQIARPWKQIFGSINAGFQGVLQSAFRGTATIGSTLRGLAASVLNAFTDMAAQIAARWLTLKIASLIFNKTAVLGEVAKAGAGGVASMAAAPWPLNMTAPAFGASMAALAASYLAIPAAAGGYDIPRGINPLVQAHGGEMILPSKHADVIRALADGGGNGGGHSAPTIQLKVQNVSGQDVLVRKRDLMKFLDELGGKNHRPDRT